MKNIALLGVLAVAAGAATAQADVVINLGNQLLAGTGNVAVTPALTGTLTGFDYSVDFQPDAAAQAGASWCSDSAVIIGAPSSGLFEWGGYDVTFGGATRVSLWSFDGSGSATPGIYTDTKSDVSAALTGSGTWTIAFGNGYSGSTPVQYNNVTVTLHGVNAVPTPASAALLGFAGLGLTRRRRR
jgi:MYXO-CTERM domain-containing protein